MEIATKYDPKSIEDKWYQFWNDHHLFASKPDSRKPFTIVIPPPNVTGVLHMGHMLNNTIQDVLYNTEHGKQRSRGARGGESTNAGLSWQ